MPFHQIAFIGLLAIGTIYGGWRGGAPERIVAALFMAAAFLSRALQIQAPHFRSTEWGIFAVDLITLVGLLWLALVSARFWPMIVAALQTAAMLAHVAAPLAINGTHQAYSHAEIAPSFVTQALLIWATRRHRRRLKHYGIDPAWTNDLPLDYLKGGIAHGSGAARPS